MADNVTLPAIGAGSTLPVVATDDVGGVQYQRIKLDIGGDGVASPVVAANPLPTIDSAGNTLIGAVNETAPASDTASSGLNGRLQRIAQRLTSIIALLPAALGAGGGLKVDGSGTALPVTGTITAVTALTNALPAGTNAIGKLAANSGVNVGDVGSITTAVTPGTAAGNLGKAEDAAHASGDTGIMALGVRADTLAPTSGTTGDYEPALYDQLGAQYVVSEERLVSIVQSPTTTNGAYSAGDVVGGLLTFANAARFSGGPITIESLVIACKTPALANSLELWLFDQTFTNVADNGVLSYSDADALNCIGVVPCGPWVDTALNSISTRSGIGLAAVLAGTSLFGQLVTRNGPSLTSTADIQVKLAIRQG